MIKKIILSTFIIFFIISMTFSLTFATTASLSDVQNKINDAKLIIKGESAKKKVSFYHHHAAGGQMPTTQHGPAVETACARQNSSVA